MKYEQIEQRMEGINQEVGALVSASINTDREQYKQILQKRIDQLMKRYNRYSNLLEITPMK